MSINIQNWPYFVFILILLVFAGTGEYLHIIPAGTFGSLLLVAIGLIAPSPAIQTHSTSTPAAAADPLAKAPVAVTEKPPTTA